MLFFFNYKPFVAIIGSLESTKSRPLSAAVRKQLQDALDRVNGDAEYKPEIVCPFRMTTDGEFQGLLRTGAEAVFVISQIDRELYPLPLRFGIGAGEINGDPRADSDQLLKSPAFLLAHQMLQDIRLAEKKHMTPTQYAKISVQNNPAPTDLFNALFSLMAVVRHSCTPRQMEIVTAYLHNGKKQADTAKALGIHQPNVQQALAASNFYSYRAALKTMAAAMAEIR